MRFEIVHDVLQNWILNHSQDDYQNYKNKIVQFKLDSKFHCKPNLNMSLTNQILYNVFSDVV